VLTEKCLPEYQQFASEVATIKRDSAIAFERYEKVKSLPYFQFPLTMEVDTLAPYNQALIQLLKVNLVQIAIDMKEPATQAKAITSLRGEAKFWRSWLAQSETLIDKMVSAAGIKLLTRLTSEIISTYPHTAVMLADVTAPLTPNEMQMFSSFRGEFSMGAIMMARVDGGEQWLYGSSTNGLGKPINRATAKVGFKPNATINLIYTAYQPYLTQPINAKTALEWNDKPPRSEAIDFQVMDIYTTKNPAGKVLAAIAVPNHVPYLLRLNDLDARMRLVEVQRQIALNKIPKSGVPGFVEKLEPQLYDPYTEAPIVWDAKTDTLKVQLHSKQAEKEAPAEIKL
jgi:hypothetical protein